MQANSRRSSKEVVSVAVQYGSKQELKKLNTNQTLENMIDELCHDFNVDYEEGKYALQVVESQHRDRYVTNITEVRDGAMLELVPSASDMITTILKHLHSQDEIKQAEALRLLNTHIKDKVIAQEFFMKDGVSCISKMICNTFLSTASIKLYLRILLTLLKMRLPEMKITVNQDVLKRLVSFVTSDNSHDADVIEYSLIILKEIIAHRKDEDKESAWIERNISMTEMKQHLWDRENPDIQKNALALINALAVGEKAAEIIRSMMSFDNLSTIYREIISSASVTEAMAHELYVYQTLVLKCNFVKLKTRVDMSGEEKDMINALVSIVNNTHLDLRRHSAMAPSKKEMKNLSEFARSSYKQDLDELSEQMQAKDTASVYKRSKSTSNIEKSEDTNYLANDIKLGKICRLTLEFMYYFAKKYRKTFLRIMLEETALGHSFCEVCEKLLQIVCVVLEIGNAPKRDAVIYQPLLFSHRFFLPELFCRVVLLLGRTRRDMKAKTVDDEEKVFPVVKRQVQEALLLKPQKLKQLDEILHKITYSNISELWQKEREQEETLKLEKCVPILELRKTREPEIIELIQEQRLAWLRAGNVFPCYNARGQKEKKKWWRIYLTSNHKTFHYGECSEKGNFLEQMKSLALTDVANIVVGKKCPHVRETRNKKMDQEAIELSFSLLLKESQSSLDFVASDQLAFCYWVDGINVLLGRPMNSQKMHDELKILLDMEVRLLLLDVDGIDISNKPPPVPPPPPNYDFHDESYA